MAIPTIHSDKSNLPSLARWLIVHFERESAFLDLAIAGGLSIKTLLQQSSPRQPAISIGEQLAQLQTEMSQHFQAVQTGREKLKSVMQSLRFDAAHPSHAHPSSARQSPRLDDLIRELDQPEQSRLQSLRREVTEKLREFQAINSSNQAVLFYTLEFHSRLLAGYVGGESSNESYNASGRSNRTSSQSLIHANF